MEVTLHGTETTVTLADEIFARGYNEALVHQVTNSYLARGHTGTKAQKTRGEASGSTRKAWRQKGMGRARAGSRRSPIWRGGGVTFAARPQQSIPKINKKMYRGAICSILSELIRQHRLSAVSELSLDSPKTQTLRAELDKLEVDDVLVIDSEVSDNLRRAAKNLQDVEVLDAAHLNPLSLIRHEKVLFTQSALEQTAAALS